MARSETLTTKLTVEDEASKPTRDFAKLIEGLDGETAQVVLALKAADVQGQLEDLLADVAQLDESDPTITPKLEQAATLKSDLDALESQIKTIDSTTVDIDTQPATQGVKDLGTEADNSRSVLANMVGNSTQDLSALGGVAGTTGVAIGQLGEYAADGNISLAGLTSFAGPMLALSVATMAVSEVLGDIAKTKAFHKEQVEKWVEALKEGGTVIGAIKDDIEETSKITFISSGDVKDATGSLDRLKLTADDFITAVSDPKALQSWKDQRDEIDKNLDSLMRTKTELQAAFSPEQQQLLDDTALKLKDYNSVISAAEQKTKDGATATEEAERITRVYGDTAEKTGRDLEKTKGNIEDVSAALDDNRFKADALTAQYDELRGALDFDQAVLNFQTAFQDAQTSVAEGTSLSKQDILSLKQEYLRMAEEIGLSPVQVKSDLQKIEQGDIDSVFYTTQAAIDKKGAAEITVKPKVSFTGLWEQMQRQFAAASGGKATLSSASSQTINVNLPRGMHAGDITRAISAHTRRSGRRYGASVVTYARR